MRIIEGGKKKVTGPEEIEGFAHSRGRNPAMGEEKKIQMWGRESSGLKSS